MVFVINESFPINSLSLSLSLSLCRPPSFRPSLSLFLTRARSLSPLTEPSLSVILYGERTITGNYSIPGSGLDFLFTWHQCRVCAFVCARKCVL